MAYKSLEAAEKARTRAREWYANNKQRAKLRINQWQHDNPERTHQNKLRSKRKLRAADPQRFKDALNEWRTRDPEKTRAQSRKDNNKAYKRHPEKIKARVKKFAAENPLKIKAYNLKRYGLSLEQFQEMLVAQNNCCLGCNTSFDAVRACVDHSHDETKRVRGLLCSKCNTALGFVNDSSSILYALIEYLKKADQEHT